MLSSSTARISVSAPLEERRDDLAQLVRGSSRIPFSDDALAADRSLVFAKACGLGLEGIVPKRAGSRYSSGNSRQWLKSKNPAFVRDGTRASTHQLIFAWRVPLGRCACTALDTPPRATGKRPVNQRLKKAPPTSI
jgi:ATP-dependent DNA ligase